MRDPIGYDLFATRPINLNSLIFGDLVFTPFRHLLGYHLGTVPTLLVMAVAYFQVKRLVKCLEICRQEIAAALIAVVAVSSDNMLMLMGTYYTDTLAVPLILEAVLSLFDKNSSQNTNFEMIWLGYIAGMAVSLKVSNAFLVLILAAAWLVMNRKAVQPVWLIGTAAAAVFPIAVFMIRGWVYTGNPLFPYANSIFKSPYFLTEVSVNEYAALDTRFGPENVTQFLNWPFHVLSHPDRMSDEKFTSGRLAVTYCAVLLVVIRSLGKKGRTDHKLLWFTGMYLAMYAVYVTVLEGYIRYICVLDIIGALLVCKLLSSVRLDHKSVWYAGASILAAMLMFQTAHMVTINQYESFDTAQRETILSDHEHWKLGMKNLLRDRNYQSYTDFVNQNVDIWVAANWDSAYAVQICADKPVYGLDQSHIVTPEAAELKTQYLRSAAEQGLRMWCATNGWVTDFVVSKLNSLGFDVISALPLDTRFTDGFDTMLLECEWHENGVKPAEVMITPVSIRLDVKGKESVTLDICMSGHAPRADDPNAYSYHVDLMDDEGNVIDYLPAFELAYLDQSVHLQADDLAGRGITQVVIWPSDPNTAGSLLIILKDA